MSEAKEMISFIEDVSVLRQIDTAAQQEGSNRSAIIRRAIRKELIFLGLLPISGKVPTDENKVKEPSL